jgi:cellobiose-specific phosphotransferase system component IIC
MKQKGFIALMSVILISAVLLSIALTAATASFFTRSGTSYAEYQFNSRNVSYACVSEALVKLAQNYSYTLGTDNSFKVGNSVCNIVSISTVSSNATSTTVSIKTNAQYRGAYSTVTALVIILNPTSTPSSPNTPPVSVVSMQENP